MGNLREISIALAVSVVLPLCLLPLLWAQPKPGNKPTRVEAHRLQGDWILLGNPRRQLAMRESSIVFLEYHGIGENFNNPNSRTVTLSSASGKQWRVDVESEDEATRLIEFVINQKLPDEAENEQWDGIPEPR